MKHASRRFAIMLIAVIIMQGMMPHFIAYAQPAPASEGTEGLSLPTGRVGQNYEYYLRTEGGLAPFTWRVVGSELPPGLRLEVSGKLTGIPTAPRRQAYSFVIEVADSSQPPQTFAQPFLLLIQAAPLRMVVTPAPLKIAAPKPAERVHTPVVPVRNELTQGEGQEDNPSSERSATSPSTGPAASTSSPAPASRQPESNPRNTGRAVAPDTDKIKVVSPTPGEIVPSAAFSLVISDIDNSINQLQIVVSNDASNEHVVDIKRVLPRGSNTWRENLSLIPPGKYTITVSDADNAATTLSVKIDRRGSTVVARSGLIRFIVPSPSQFSGAETSNRTFMKSEGLARDIIHTKATKTYEVEVLDADHNPLAGQHVAFKKLCQYGTLQTDPAPVATDGNGHAFMDFTADELPGTCEIEASADGIGTTRFQVVGMDLARWRYTAEIGSEFNQDNNDAFGHQFLYLGLTANTHWGHSFHTQFDARLTSILQRDLLMEAGSATPKMMPAATTGKGLGPSPAADTPAAMGPSELDLVPFFNARKAFESSLAIFYDPYKLFKETKLASDRARFGFIAQYAFRTRIDRKTETEKADLQKMIAAETDAAKRMAIQMKLDALDLVAPPPKDVISEIFAGLRIAHYEKHYFIDCIREEEAGGDDSPIKAKNPSPASNMKEAFALGLAHACPQDTAPYMRILERNSPETAHFNIMWGVSEHLQNHERILVLRRDAAGNPILNPDNSLIFDPKRTNFTGRIMLDGYMKVPRMPIGLRFRGNLGPGEDEIRFSIFSTFDLSRLRSVFNF